jgi:hypothetical protein
MLKFEMEKMLIAFDLNHFPAVTTFPQLHTAFNFQFLRREGVDLHSRSVTKMDLQTQIMLESCRIHNSL